MKPLSPRERKLVAVAILIAMVVGGWTLILAPVIDGFRSRADRRAVLLATYAANERLIGQAGRLRAIAEQQARAQAAFSIPAPSQDDAAQLLAERVGADASAVGGLFRSADPLDARPGWATVSATVVLTRPQLLDLLQRLQATPPWLVIEAMQINADRAIDSNHADQLEVKLDVSVPVRAQSAALAPAR